MNDLLRIAAEKWTFSNLSYLSCWGNCMNEVYSRSNGNFSGMAIYLIVKKCFRNRQRQTVQYETVKNIHSFWHKSIFAFSLIF